MEHMKTQESGFGQILTEFQRVTKSDLFNRLPIEIQQEIMNETNHSDFETQIERFSDAFVDFRYIYENIFKTKDLNLKFWEDFSSAIYKIVPTHIARKGAPLYIDPSIK